jgi:hypothetical protein
VVTDEQVDCPLPRLDVGAPREVADFVIARLGLRAPRSEYCSAAA